jgi:group I intron endonuclease
MVICGIYKIENLINGKVYIGQSVDVNYRLTNHKSESFNPNSNSYETAIHRAIRKYGIENFSFEVIERCSPDELKDREVYWIKKYESYEKGYNMTHGGEGVPSINRQYIYELWDKGMSIGEIYEYTGHGKHSIINILTNYENYNKDESYKRGKKVFSQCMSRKIEQYDLNGKFIAIYNSVAEAAEVVNTKPHNINEAIRGKLLSAAGFQWVLEGDNPPGIYDAKSTNKKRPVVRLDKNKKFIEEYESIGDATRSMNFKSTGCIWACCNDHSRTSGGYYWMYKEDYEADLAAH